MSFLVQFNGNGGQPVMNFANQGDKCTLFDGTSLFKCPEIEADITACQQTYGKTILLSVGGATYTEGGFSSSDAAVSMANKVWAMFGPQQSGSSALRPFGSAVIDGFDFDFEATVSNMPAFGNQLRSNMDSTTGKKYLLTAAPQCPYPDAADGPMLDGSVSFDAIFIQFYNNYCGVSSYVAGATDQWNYNFNTWDTWAKNTSKNKAVKVLVGVPGNTGAGAGYIAPDKLAAVLKYSAQYSSFGGVMIWDASQAYANSGFIGSVDGSLSTLSKRAMRRGWRNEEAE
ncbi:glycoside hydrolase [Lophium mytilinum]|uniref:chitinase n=1 Tax=Lophium mytilinum TaxID=390894 RepID=A0A6A6R0Q6_9PEZI|nr:glycoside hydrolase [Lophium mytilinum]